MNATAAMHKLKRIQSSIIAATFIKSDERYKMAVRPPSLCAQKRGHDSFQLYSTLTKHLRICVHALPSIWTPPPRFFFRGQTRRLPNRVYMCRCPHSMIDIGKKEFAVLRNVWLTMCEIFDVSQKQMDSKKRIVFCI